jgi:hypothetical protein
MRYIIIGWVIALSIAAACTSTVPPRVTRAPSWPLDANAHFFVTATEQRDRVLQSLDNANLVSTDDWADARYSLEVKFGSSRSKDLCGTVHNVVYQVYENARSIMVVKGRGATGACYPNILDDLSRVLAQHAEG